MDPIRSFNISPNPLELSTVLNKPLSSPTLAKESGESTPPSFSQLIREAIQRVDQAQKDSDQLLQNLISHKSDEVNQTDLHEVVIAWEKADISLKMLMQVRSKVIEAYQEVMRMPV